MFHVVSRIYDRNHLFDDEGKEFFLRTMRAYETLLGVEVLTFCLMDNHFHLLVRVPHRPEGFDVPLKLVLIRLEQAVGQQAVKLVRQQIALWERTGNLAAIEAWRQRQLRRMFSLSEFLKGVKYRFTRWFNRRTGRQGGLWESRFTSVIVEEEQRALRTIAAYIDLNPVRAGIVSDPGDYRWSGYTEAMAGKSRARRGLVRIIGQTAWPRGTAAGQPWRDVAIPALVERRALVFYRGLLGGQGTARQRKDGTVGRRGISEKVRQRLTSPSERELAAEIVKRRVQHFTRGVLIGSRLFIDSWFAANREIVTGRSRTERKQGSRSLGRPALRGLYAFRDVK